jgi:hypothetical protein
MNGDDEEATKRVVRRASVEAPKARQPAKSQKSSSASARAKSQKSSSASARAKPSETRESPRLPVYGTPPGSDPTLPLYGTRESVKSAPPARHDFDPRAEEKAAAAKAAADARKAKAAEAARAAKVRAQKRAAEKAAKKAAKRDAARLAYAEKKERLAHIAEVTRRARRQRSNLSGSISYAKQRSRRAASQAVPARSPETVRPDAPARRIGTGPKVLIAALVVAGAILVPIVVTDNSPSSPTVSDGVDWAEYPGWYFGDESRTLSAPRLEQAETDNIALLEELRAAVQQEVDVSWVEHGTATESPLENAWGGPSMLSDWESPRWYTTQEISDVELKERLVDRVSEVLADHGFDDARLLNDPADTSASDESLKLSYGAVNPADQVVWDLRASRFDNGLTDFTFTITDFSKDSSGEFTKDAQRDEEYFDRPVSSIAMTLTTHGLLAADDEAEFRERAAPFEDKRPPQSSRNG